MTDDWHARITLNPAVLAGKPTVRGLRISVEHVLRALSSGVPESELLAEYPDLEPEDSRACLAYAADLVETERVYPVEAGASGLAPHLDSSRIRIGTKLMQSEVSSI
jgi:uncharacterized protein (DUF433 family)